MSSRAADLEALHAIARDAAAVIARVYATDFAVDYKGPADPVTRADREANDLICARLAAAYPGVPIVAEESDPATFEGFHRAERAFFVDPLDGTLEFVAKNGQFAVMIGLVEAGRAVLGVVLAPATGIAWLGALGEGAWRVGASGERESVRVTQTARAEDATVLVSRSHRGARLSAVLDGLAPREARPHGGAGLKGALVAAGDADVYLQPGRAGKRWDACAIDALVCAAGGRFTDAAGAAIDYTSGALDNAAGLVATNGLLHARVIEAIAAVGA